MACFVVEQDHCDPAQDEPLSHCCCRMFAGGAPNGDAGAGVITQFSPADWVVNGHSRCPHSVAERCRCFDRPDHFHSWTVPASSALGSRLPLVELVGVEADRADQVPSARPFVSHRAAARSGSAWASVAGHALRRPTPLRVSLWTASLVWNIKGRPPRIRRPARPRPGRPRPTLLRVFLPQARA